MSESSSASKLILYSYWQSSCSWRVRFALNLKVLVDGNVTISDSRAILLYLEENYPQNALLPADPQLRAINLQAASNLFTSEKSRAKSGSSRANGFLALEKLLKDFASGYATGNEVYMAHVFLAPQIEVATTRFNINMSKFPILSKIHESNKALLCQKDSLMPCHKFAE